MDTVQYSLTFSLTIFWPAYGLLNIAEFVQNATSFNVAIPFLFSLEVVCKKIASNSLLAHFLAIYSACNAFHGGNVGVEIVILSH